MPGLAWCLFSHSVLIYASCANISVHYKLSLALTVWSPQPALSRVSFSFSYYCIPVWYGIQMNFACTSLSTFKWAILSLKWPFLQCAIMSFFSSKPDLGVGQALSLYFNNPYISFLSNLSAYQRLSIVLIAGCTIVRQIVLFSLKFIF